VSVDLDSLKRHWFVACESRDLGRRPVARTILGVPVALFRNAGGVAALLDRCPHRNAPLSCGKVVSETIRCSYHGWSFGADGRCREIPGFAAAFAPGNLRVERFRAVENDGLIWVALRDDAEHRPASSNIEANQKFDRFLWRTETDGVLDNILENLLDCTHPHFIHGGIVRSAKRRRGVSVEIRRREGMAEAIYTEGRHPAGLLPRLFEGTRSVSIGRYIPPATAELEYRDAHGPRFFLTAHITPINARKAQVFAILATPRRFAPAWAKQLVLKAALWPVLAQDRRILSLQQQQIDRFGGANFVSTPLDVMRPHIQYFLNHLGSAYGEDADSRLEISL
jgi:phenylpropionate dioxygenase-like ring-hydroxylating dioxygenase large terminal subunit